MTTSNRRGVGFASYPYDETDDEPVRPYVPPAAQPTVNPTAAAVSASLNAQAPTGNNAIKPPVLTPAAKVVYFSDDAQPYKPSPASVDEAPAPAAGNSKLLMHIGIGLGLLAAWRWLR